MSRFYLVVILCTGTLIVSAVPLDSPIVRTENGYVQGTTRKSDVIGKYYEYKGIPYAAPPIGDFRFRDPQPHRGWDDVYNATKHGSTCANMGLIKVFVGSENCLFVNVYTADVTGSRSVMVYIYGGGYSRGSGDSDSYGPQYLIEDGVVVVTFNYRVGIFGFFSMGDRIAPGNYAMKDMIFLLKWVQRNIYKFGGDPDNVTIFGESAGASSVHLLILSPLGKGLFHRAISQSGTALAPWAYAPDPTTFTKYAIKVLDIKGNTNEEILSNLRKVSAEDLALLSPAIYEAKTPRGLRPLTFAPVNDAHSDEPFLPDHPRRILESGRFTSVPYIVGHTDAEFLFMIYEPMVDHQFYSKMNESPDLIIPYDWDVSTPSPEATQCAQSFKNFYLKGENLSIVNEYNYTIYYTDHVFAFPTDEVVKLHASLQRDDSPIYQFIFSYVGDLNLIKMFSFLLNYPGAVHGDDLFYLFNTTQFGVEVYPDREALLTRKRMVRMWTNFAKYADPTPNDDIIGINWPPATKDLHWYLEIGSELKPALNSNHERLTFWYKLRELCSKSKYRINL